MNLPKIGVMLFFFVFVVQGKAQIDTADIKSYADQIMIRANLNTNIESYIFSEGENRKENQQILSINNKTKISLSIDYRIISAILSFAPRFFPDNKDNELKGNSSYIYSNPLLQKCEGILS